jgi:hypothetical protein
MYQLKFTLKQHTPIIHFQHDQDGATLRATEVKPKLDRFIIEQCGGLKKCREDHKDWFLSEKHDALDYKLRISENLSEEIEIENFHKNAPMYFGNMGNENPPKHFKIIELTKCTIICFNNKLISEIKKNIIEFYYANNFGTRQGKGYGSFEIIELDGIAKTNYLPKHNFHFKILTGNWQEALFQINLFYKSLRSGINEVQNLSHQNPENPNKAYLQQNTVSKFYFKPLIFLYAKHQDKQWDKKTIKEVYLNDFAYRKLTYNEKKDLKWNEGDKDKMEEFGLTQQIDKYIDSDILEFSQNIDHENFFWDFKDVFGLSSSEQWKSYGKTISKVNATNNSTQNNFLKKSNKADDFIDRMKSPLFFKPIKSSENEFTIYMSYANLPDSYRGQKFIIYDNTREENAKLCLQIPSNFSFKEFFDFIFDKSNFNIEEHVSNNFKNYSNRNNFNTNYYNALNKIFEQLQTVNNP